ncbi:acyl-CoA thioesterase [Ligilactobacillus acidipiscis]|uniref:acyl-CoA thioesterase n=1 Tax=Ligilactobacillus acidipiscis TaxID=89059 RepID=UPI000704B058|nr:hotdog domain-containing protein [Ligilactobacillus acidipiscis]GAW64957.1 acyl-CoA thioester hydrolase [Ligilactobacillus acidipiscis]GEN21379.1 acyl-CoA thioesterase [Ligilactobacillus acidipiscis]
MSEPMTCRQTLAVTSHRVLTGDLNEHETVYGGRLLEMLDGTASISASRLAKSVSVTASMDQTNFIAPFGLQDSFCIETYVSGCGKRSIEVFAKIIGEHLQTGERYIGLTSFLTFVVTDKSVSLRKIIPETAEEKMINAGYEKRQENRISSLRTQKEFNSSLSSDYPWDLN